MSDLVIQNTPNTAPARADLFSQGPREMVQHASELATVLKDVVTKQKLSVRIGPNEYVKAEGWSTMGCMLGILPREKSVVEHADGSFEAVVELYSLKTGAVVGQGSALCGIDEKRWGNADRFARRSMAITRATGKAYRLGFSWVMTLAGYQPTPAEEMPDEEREAPRPKRAASIYTGSSEQQKIIQDILAKQKVPEGLWPEIDQRLRGRPSTDLRAAVEEAKNTAGVFS